MNAELGVAMDAPAAVALAIRRMLATNQPEAVVGWPEKLFARLNGALPRLVDGAIRKQLPVIRRHAEKGVVAMPAAAVAADSPVALLQRKLP